MSDRVTVRPGDDEGHTAGGDGRVAVRKTYKLAIGGAFPRSESGRSYPVTGADGSTLAWAAQGSRKDLRDAVRAARDALAGWAGATAYNRGQVLYRVAELLEGRTAQFVDELVALGSTPAAASAEVAATVDRWVWYAGWTDKLSAIGGTVNPVAGPYFVFTVPEPTGVVGIVAPEAPALLGLVSRLAPAMAGGNVAVVVASEAAPLPAITLAEVLATSDVPAGVVNVITGRKPELLPWLAAHLDVNALDTTGVPDELRRDVEERAAEGIVRLVRASFPGDAWATERAQSPDDVLALTEAKTVWHPIGR